VTAAVPRTPLSVRLFDATQPSPLAASALVAGGFVLLWLLYSACVEAVAPDQKPPGLWSETLVRGIIFGYVPALSVYSRRGALDTLRRLRSRMRGTATEIDRAILEAVEPSLAWRLAAGLAGAIGGLWPVLLAPELFGVAGADAGWGDILWDGSYFVVTGWLIFRAVAQDVHIARGLSRIGGERFEIDLLDVSGLALLARWSQRAVLLWVIFFWIVSLFFLGPGRANMANLAGIIPLLIVSATAFLLPVSGARRKIREAKRAELRWVRGQIAGERDALRGGTNEGARLANLVAYESVIERVHEWPFDVSSLVRVLLYVGLGVGSWFGGALVERLLDALAS
jgi:hypothetical protein